MYDTQERASGNESGKCSFRKPLGTVSNILVPVEEMNMPGHAKNVDQGENKEIVEENNGVSSEDHSFPNENNNVTKDENEGYQFSTSSATKFETQKLISQKLTQNM